MIRVLAVPSRPERYRSKGRSFAVLVGLGQVARLPALSSRRGYQRLGPEFEKSHIACNPTPYKKQGVENLSGACSSRLVLHRALLNRDTEPRREMQVSGHHLYSWPIAGLDWACGLAPEGWQIPSPSSRRDEQACLATRAQQFALWTAMSQMA